MKHETGYYTKIHFHSHFVDKHFIVTINRGFPFNLIKIQISVCASNVNVHTEKGQSI